MPPRNCHRNSAERSAGTNARSRNPVKARKDRDPGRSDWVQSSIEAGNLSADPSVPPVPARRVSGSCVPASLPAAQHPPPDLRPLHFARACVEMKITDSPAATSFFRRWQTGSVSSGVSTAVGSYKNENAPAFAISAFENFARCARPPESSVIIRSRRRLEEPYHAASRILARARVLPRLNDPPAVCAEHGYFR